MFRALKKREDTVRGRPHSMCQASSALTESGTAVAMKAFDSSDATVIVSEELRATISSSMVAMRAFTDIPAPYLVMYLDT